MIRGQVNKCLLWDIGFHVLIVIIIKKHRIFKVYKTFTMSIKFENWLDDGEN